MQSSLSFDIELEVLILQHGDIVIIERIEISN